MRPTYISYRPSYESEPLGTSVTWESRLGSSKSKLGASNEPVASEVTMGSVLQAREGRGVVETRPRLCESAERASLERLGPAELGLTEEGAGEGVQEVPPRSGTSEMTGVRIRSRTSWAIRSPGWTLKSWSLRLKRST